MSKEPKPLLQFLYDPATNDLLFIQDEEAINALGPHGVKSLQGLMHNVAMQHLGRYSKKRHARLKKVASKNVRTKLLAAAQADHDKQHALSIAARVAIGLCMGAAIAALMILTGRIGWPGVF